MNILQINSFKIPTPIKFDVARNNASSPTNFGLTMPKPLSKDTVSFKGAQQTIKTAGSRANAISLRTARILQDRVKKAHGYLNELFHKEFDGKLSTEHQTNTLTLLNRIKSEDSICQKTASRDWGTLKVPALLTNMTDISGFCFVLEDKKALNEFINKYIQLIKTNKIDIVEAEYHRLPPKYLKGGRVDSFDSLDPIKLQKLKNTIIEHKNPSYQLWKDVDSMSGYSGLHLTLRNGDGTYTEVQVMTRGMHNFKQVENLYYKIRNGKDVDPKYNYIAQFMQNLKPKNPQDMTDEEKAMQKAIRKYTQEAYEEMLSRPFDKTRRFLKVKDAISLNKKEKEMLNDYDFNKIGDLMKACEEIAKH